MGVATGSGDKGFLEYCCYICLIFIIWLLNLFTIILSVPSLLLILIVKTAYAYLFQWASGLEVVLKRHCPDLSRFGVALIQYHLKAIPA